MYVIKKFITANIIDAGLTTIHKAKKKKQTKITPNKIEGVSADYLNPWPPIYCQLSPISDIFSV